MFTTKQRVSCKLIWALLLGAPGFSQTISIDCGAPGDTLAIGGASYTILTPGATGDLTLRYGAFRYPIPAAAGTYNVKLFLRESGTISTIGQRAFSVTINGTPVLFDFDLYEAAGLVPIEKNYTATSENGYIRINFSYSRKSAIVSRIEVTAKPPSGGTEIPESGPGIIVSQNPYKISVDTAQLGQVFASKTGGNVFEPGKQVFQGTVKDAPMRWVASERPPDPEANDVYVRYTGEVEMFNGIEWRRLVTEKAP